MCLGGLKPDDFASRTSNIGGTDRVMYDEENGDARIDCDAETFIEDVGDWA